MSQINNSYKHYISALLQTLLIAVFTIMPTLSIYASIQFDKETTKSFTDFYKSGEFFLYAVSFSSSAFLIYHSKKQNLGYLHLALILLASIAYAATLNVKSPNIATISSYSQFFFFGCLTLFYFAQVYSNKMSADIDVRDISNSQIQNIQEGLS